MKIKLQSFIILFNLLLFLILNINYLQAQNNDFGTWTGIEVSKKLTSRLTVSFSEEIRLKENMTQLNNFFSEAGAGYKINEIFKVAGNYRFNQKQERDYSFSTRHRLNIDFRLQKKFKPFEFTYRMRGQSQLKDYFTNEKGNFPENTLRHKLELAFDFDHRITPMIATELFYPINEVSKVTLREIRFIAGAEYEINKVNSIGINYLIEKERRVNNPLTNYIIKVGYNYRFM